MGFNGIGGWDGAEIGAEMESRLRWGWDMGFSGIEGGMGFKLGLRWNWGWDWDWDGVG